MPITKVSGEKIGLGKVGDNTRKFISFIGKNTLILIGLCL